MKRTKIIASLCALVLTIACLTFGVYSAVKTSFTASGSITFNSYGLDVLVEGTITNAVAAGDGALNAKYYGATKADHGDSNYTNKVGTNGSLPQWSMGAIGFNELDTTQTDEDARNTITIELKIKNYSGYPIAANATLKFGTSGSETETAFSSTFQNTVVNNAGNIADTAGTEGVLTVTITPKSFSSAISGNFKMEVEIKPYKDPTILLQYDSTNNYYYLEMGHLNDAAQTAVRWRLISQDGATSYNATTTKPTSLNGVYILETWSENSDCYRDIYFDRGATDTSGQCSTDYATSEIRSYLLGKDITNSDNHNGKAYYGDNDSATVIDVAATNFLTDFNISTNDEVYNLIQKVTFGTSGNTKSTNGNCEDAFWLMSKSEVETILCGGKWDNSKTNWDANSTSDRWGFRTFYGVIGDGSYDESAEMNASVCEVQYFVRPAFQIGL